MSLTSTPAPFCLTLSRPRQDSPRSVPPACLRLRVLLQLVHPAELERSYNTRAAALLWSLHGAVHVKSLPVPSVPGRVSGIFLFLIPSVLTAASATCGAPSASFTLSECHLLPWLLRVWLCIQETGAE